MPGFLAEFAGTVIVDADTGQIVESATRPNWWVELLRNLPHADHVEADKILADAMALDTDQSGGDARMRMGGAGLVGQQEEILARSIVAWNLTDENDQPLPVGDTTGVHDAAKKREAVAITRASLARLPEKLILALKLVAVSQNQPRRGTEAATFPDPAPVSGGDDGVRGVAVEPAAVAGEVHA